jgi:hypothetical protein
MFPGEYSGAVQPWKHYLPLEKDFSNLPEVAERIRDGRFVSELTARAYDELIGSGTFSERRFVAAFDDQLAERAHPRETRARYRPALAKLEQASVGRSYHLSTLYGWAREAILAYLGVKNALRFPSLRRLLVYARRDGPAAGATSFWDDLFRLSILTSVQQGLPVLAGDAFHVVARYDEHDERLTLTSTPGTGSGRSAEQVLDTIAAATRSRRLREIVWSHATLEQYVPLRFGPIGLRVAFDVGRYDAYGVYRFDALTDFARERPEELVAALAPLMTAPGSGEPPTPAIDKRGPRP